jgi:hypothetical protein
MGNFTAPADYALFFLIYFRFHKNYHSTVCIIFYHTKLRSFCEQKWGRFRTIILLIPSFWLKQRLTGLVASAATTWKQTALPKWKTAANYGLLLKYSEAVPGAYVVTRHADVGEVEVFPPRIVRLGLQRGEWSVSNPGHFSAEKSNRDHCIGGWVSPRACPDVVVKRNSDLPGIELRS